QMQMVMAGNPALAQKIAGTIGNVAKLDCDIILAEAPDSLSPVFEQWQALVELKKYDAAGELPYRALIEAAPDLHNKDKVLQMMDQAAQVRQNPAAQQAQQLAMMAGQAKVHQTEADARLKEAQTAKTMVEANVVPFKTAQGARPPSPQSYELPPEVQVAQALAD